MVRLEVFIEKSIICCGLHGLNFGSLAKGDLAMKRFAVNKSRAAAGFRKDMKHTKSINMARGPMRGGWRL